VKGFLNEPNTGTWIVTTKRRPQSETSRKPGHNYGFHLRVHTPQQNIEFLDVEFKLYRSSREGFSNWDYTERLLRVVFYVIFCSVNDLWPALRQIFMCPDLRHCKMSDKFIDTIDLSIYPQALSNKLNNSFTQLTKL